MIIEPVLDFAQKKFVFHLRYKAYAARPHDNRPSKAFLDIYDYYTNCKSFLLFDRDVPIGSIRSCIYLDDSQWNSVPALELFRREIDSEIGLREKFIEINRFALPYVSALARTSHGMLLRAAITEGIAHKCTFVVMVVNDKSKDLWRRLGFQTYSAAKPGRAGGPCVRLMVQAYASCLRRFVPHIVGTRG